MSELADTPIELRAERLPRWAAYGLSLVLVAVAAILAVVVDYLQAIPNLSLIFVLPVVVAAVSFGWGPALAAAVAGVFAYNFFLIAPRYTLNVADPANWWALALLLITAAILSAVAAQSRRRALDAARAGDQTAALQMLSRTLVAVAGRKGAAQASADALARLFRAPAVILLREPEGLAEVARAGGGPHGPGGVTEADEEAANWALATRTPTRGGAAPLDGAVYDFWPVVTPQRQEAVIGVSISLGEGGRPDNPDRLVEIVSGYLAVALDREAYAALVLEGRVEVEKERLKADLVAAVSHDLKTPLSTVLFTLQSLKKFGKAHDAKTRAELLDLAETETARLSGMVANLLDMNRLDAGAVVVRPAPVAAAELVQGALERAGGALQGCKLANEVAADGPLLLADAALVQTALANVLQNAGKYAPKGAAVRIRAGADAGVGWIEVTDEGPGFAGAIEPMFEKFSRGVEGDGRPPGTGLGLAIARGFLEAQGGRIEAKNLPRGKGALVRLTLPLARVAEPA